MKRSEKIKNQVLSLYKTSGWKRWFAGIRIWEAPCWEVERLIPRKGLILDLGCGEGILTNLWAISSKTRKIIGIDKDISRVNQADRGIENIKFCKGDILTVDLPKCNAIVLFHVLHHLNSFSDQDKLINRCYKSLVKGGKLIIVEVDIKTTLRYLISWLTDHFVAPLLFNGKLYEASIYYRNKRNWLNLMERTGFNTRAFTVEENKPFTNLVIECVK